MHASLSSCYDIVMCTYLHNINLLHGILSWAAKIVAAIHISFQLIEMHNYIIIITHQLHLHQLTQVQSCEWQLTLSTAM